MANINSFSELYRKAVEPGNLISSFITGHLAVEFLLRKLVQIYDPALSRFADDISHARLIDLSFDIGTINEKQKNVLILINKTRNKFAHQFTYAPSISELKDLYKKASEAFTDMTDGISQGLDELSSAESIQELDSWVILELFVQISYDLYNEYQTRGGDIVDF